MSQAILSASKYRKLLADVRKIIEVSKVQAVAAANQELVNAYWQIGKRICTEGLTERGGYGDSILEDLAEELDISAATIFRTVQFFQTYPKLPKDNNLSWSHYRVLLPLSNPDERRWYEDIVQEESWTAAQLAQAVKSEKFKNAKKRKGTNKLNRPKQATYVYKAHVERVVDGDTILLHIDLGFTVLKEQRIRLAGIDCPAIDEPKGREAFQYVRDVMARVPFVMVKTNKIDIYGRYVGHIFYLPNSEDKVKIFEQGRYLSQELVDRDLAKVI